MAEVWRLVMLGVDVQKQHAQVRQLSGESRRMPLEELPDGVWVGDVVHMTETASGPTSEIEWIGRAHGA